MKPESMPAAANQAHTFNSSANAGRTKRFPWVLTISITLGLAVATLSANGQTLTVLHSFTGGADGGYPRGLIRDAAGNLYGSTIYGGLGSGTVFKVDAAGNETVLYAFTGKADGALPNDLVQSGQYFYSTTSFGGAHRRGTVFRVDTAGKETVLYSFTGGADGLEPLAGVIRDAAGNLYGTSLFEPRTNNSGTVFKLDFTGKQSVLFTFTFAAGAANIPMSALVQDAAGNLYGTTLRGGDRTSCKPSGCGTVFKVDTAGKETVVYSFTGGADGELPQSGLIRDAAGNFYGTTTMGGAFNSGTVYQLDKNGNETVLYTFTGGADGNDPNGVLLQDAAGNLYGTTVLGGAFGNGTVFMLDKTGKETVLYTFTGPMDGANPFGGLVQDESGNLYGTADRGGPFNNGTVFKLVP
jgi:uncharacterized repeat protein (TIGR03803 family)